MLTTPVRSEELLVGKALAAMVPTLAMSYAIVGLAGVASLVPAAVTALMSFRVIPQSLLVALGLAAGLVVVDALGWRAVAASFDRERLVTKL